MMDESAGRSDKCVLSVEERDWLEKARKDQKGAFDGLLKPHREKLRRACKNLCRDSPIDPEDLWGITLHKAYQNVKMYRGEQNVQGWLFMIMNNALRDEIKKYRGQEHGWGRATTFTGAGLEGDPREAASGADQEADPAPTPEEALLTRELLDAWYNQLPTQLAKLVWMFYLELKLQAPDIAHRFNIDVIIIRQILRPKKSLVEWLREYRGFFLLVLISTRFEI
ncbi:MAG: hypothetical protein JWL77_4054 [Chthonomonadaceae bacterium]|nr:hypothetical protein [Chthonomonadaceae bacterium]